jgi:hypothetical protein
MDIRQYKKFIARVINSDNPTSAFKNLAYFLMDEDFAHLEILRVAMDILRQNLTLLMKKGITIESIQDIIDPIETFREFRATLCEALLLSDANVKLEAEVTRLSKAGISKLAIYNIFLEFFLYIQYRIEFYHDLEERHSDIIADSILDRLWGSGWDKGARLLPDEPDIGEILGKHK